MTGRNVFFIAVIQAAVELRLCAPNTGPPTESQHLQEYLEQLEPEESVYNPTHGYEPYWVDGDWVFMDLKPDPNGTTTRKPTLVCGDECPYIYREVKQVCGRKTNNLLYRGCHQNCWGYWIDDIVDFFRTFDTYCDFLNAQCHSKTYNKWMFVHSGKCISSTSSYMKPISVGQHLLSRITHYYSELSRARANHSLPPIHFT